MHLGICKRTFKKPAGITDEMVDEALLKVFKPSVSLYALAFQTRVVPLADTEISPVDSEPTPHLAFNKPRKGVLETYETAGKFEEASQDLMVISKS